MNLIHHKLRSRRGASISFALLLFLVCAVVGSVVLVAGTAAAGRISQAAEADQRYYSVTSAAELLKGQIEGDMNRVVITQEDTTPIGWSIRDNFQGVPADWRDSDYSSADFYHTGCSIPYLESGKDQ